MTNDRGLFDMQGAWNLIEWANNDLSFYGEVTAAMELADSALIVVMASGIMRVNSTRACDAPSINAASAYSHDMPLNVA